MKLFINTFFIIIFSNLAYGQSFFAHQLAPDTFECIYRSYESAIQGSSFYEVSYKLKSQNNSEWIIEENINFSNISPVNNLYRDHKDTIFVNSNEFLYNTLHKLVINDTIITYLFFTEESPVIASTLFAYDYINMIYHPMGVDYTDTLPSNEGLLPNHIAYPKDVVPDESTLDPIHGPTTSGAIEWYLDNQTYNEFNRHASIVFRDTTMDYKYIRIRSNVYHPTEDYKPPMISSSPNFYSYHPEWITHGERFAGKWIASKYPVMTNTIEEDLEFAFDDTIIYDTATCHTYLSYDLPLNDITSTDFPYLGFEMRNSVFVMYDDFKMYGVISDTVCWGDGFWANNQYYYESGHIEVRDTTPLSTRKMYGVDLVVLEPHYVDTNFAQVCEGESYTYFGESFNTTGWHTVTFGSDNSPPASYLACDTVHKLFLTVNNIESEIVQNGTNFHLLNPQSGETYQWIDATTGLPISGATASSFAPTQNGNYALIITKGLCDEQSNNLEMTGIGLDESEYSLNIFPNPFGDQIHVELQGLAKQVSIKCYDSSAQLVFSLSKSNCSSFDVDTKALAKGVYVLELYVDDQFKVKKMIKK